MTDNRVRCQRIGRVTEASLVFVAGPVYTDAPPELDCCCLSLLASGIGLCAPEIESCKAVDVGLMTKITQVDLCSVCG